MPAMDINWDQLVTILTAVAAVFGGQEVVKKVQATAAKAAQVGRDAAKAAYAVLHTLGNRLELDSELQAFLIEKIDDLLDHEALTITDKLRKVALQAARDELGRQAILQSAHDLKRRMDTFDIDKIVAAAKARGRANAIR